MPNLYKQRFVAAQQNNTRVINSNQLLAAKLEELAKQARKEQQAAGGFVEGLNPVPVAPPPDPEEILEEARRTADELVAKAREEAQQILEQANATKDQITEAARAGGERKGYEEGMQKAAEEAKKQEAAYQARQKELERRGQELEREYEALRDDLEPQILAAVSDVFEKVFYIELEDTKSVLLHLVKIAVLKIENTREFLIRVSPDNFCFLEDRREELTQQVGQSVKLEVEADSSLDETQCMIETDSGFFDCSIDVELNNLIRELRLLSV